MKKLTNNVGNKIKRASIVLFILAIIWSFIESFLYFERSYLKITKAGEVVMNGEAPDFFGGIVVLLVGILISFVVFFLLYGFGDIVENVAMIKQKICSEVDSKDNSKDNSAAVNEDENDSKDDGTVVNADETVNADEAVNAEDYNEN